MKPSTPKGTRDFSPAEMAGRNYIFDTVKAVFRLHGFAQIETPAMENSETLMGKYGEEGDRLIFKILESGDYLRDLWNEKKLIINPIDLPKIKASLPQFIIDSIKTDSLIFSDGFKDFWKSCAVVEDSRVRDTLWYLAEAYAYYIEGHYADEPMIVRVEPDGTEVTSAMYYRELYDAGSIEFLKKIILFDFETFLNSTKAHSVLRESGFVWDSKSLSAHISQKALRYDLTVPFARYVVQHRNDLTFPFKRFQIQPVWRADRPQKGRYREFYQCDVDVIGSDSLLNEVELVQIIDSVFGKLGIPVTLKLNNRKLLAAIAQVVGAPDAFVDITVALDKLDKIGEEKVVEELKQRGISDSSIEKLLPLIRFTGDTHQKLDFLATFLGENELGQKGIAEVQTVIGTAQPLISSNTVIELDLTLARGLNYYTGAIFEVKSNLPNTLTSTICGGGRYDDLTGIFGLPNVSGVGISFGADRIYDVMLEAGLFPSSAQEGTKVLFANFGEKEAAYCLPLVKQLREAGIATELYPDAAKLKKQFGHADSLGIPFVAMVGESEMAEGLIGLKDMKSGEQVRVTVGELVERLSTRNPM